MRQAVFRFLQFALSLGIGCYVYAAAIRDGETGKTAVLCALAVGIGGIYLLMKLYVLIRYGWKAAKSMTWEP